MGRASKSLKVRKGDTVEVIAGKDKGKRGIVERVDRERSRVVVEGVAIAKRHTRPRPASNAAEAAKQQNQGGVIEREGPIHMSNVMLLDPKDGKPTRVGIEVREGRRFRIARRSGTSID